MTPESIASYIAIGLASVTFLYTFLANSPKDHQARTSRLEIDHAETKRDLANLVKNLDRLAELVYARERKTNNGRNG